MSGDINDYSRYKDGIVYELMCSCRMPRMLYPADKTVLTYTSKLPCKTDKRVYQAISSILDYQI